MSHDPSGRLQQRIDEIKAEIAALGPLRPGTLTRQYNVCGTPGCRCKEDPDQRHGPYHQLSYTWNGKSSSEFVRAPEIARVEEQLRNYVRLRSLVTQWVDAAIKLARLERQKLRYPQEISPPTARASKKKQANRR
jgi:Family of unknown function (DUF6788)